VPEVLTGNAHRFAHRRGGCHRAHPAPSRALAKGGCVHSEPTRRAKRPSIRGSTTPFPDYDTEPVVAFQDYRCPSRLIC
jgi:hypothetical protein